MKAGAIYENAYLLGTSMARPLMAKKLVEIAEQEGAFYICHGCTGKGNDQVRFETTIKALNPAIKIIAPWRTWDFHSREDLIEYAKAHDIPIHQTVEKIYSRDENIWHISHEGGNLENPWNEHLKDIHVLSCEPEDAPDEVTYVDIDFEQGVPVGLNGEKMDAVSLLNKLNELGSKNGIGTIDIIENRLVGMKSRGVYETPGGTILYAAHTDLERLILDRDTMQYKNIVSAEIRADDLRRTLVHSAQKRNLGFRRCNAGKCDGNRKDEIIQRKCFAGCKQIRLFVIQRRIRDLQCRRNLQSARRGGIHQPFLPAAHPVISGVAV